jgi:hypothetical protein
VATARDPNMPVARAMVAAVRAPRALYICDLLCYCE